jgi:hypothetical protein
MPLPLCLNLQDGEVGHTAIGEEEDNPATGAGGSHDLPPLEKPLYRWERKNGEKTCDTCCCNFDLYQFCNKTNKEHLTYTSICVKELNQNSFSTRLVLKYVCSSIQHIILYSSLD